MEGAELRKLVEGLLARELAMLRIRAGQAKEEALKRALLLDAVTLEEALNSWPDHAGKLTLDGALEGK